MKKRIIIFTCIAFLISSICEAGLRSKVNSGNRLYKNEKYQEALNEYKDAQFYAPNNTVAHFNTGNALYKTGNFEEAIKEFERSVCDKNVQMQAKSYYNMGNALYKAGKLQEAVENYKKSLTLDPGDKDAKYNLEFVLKKMKENKKQQQKKQQQEKKQDMSKEDAKRVMEQMKDNEKRNQEKRRVPIPKMKMPEEDW